MVWFSILSHTKEYNFYCGAPVDYISYKYLCCAPPYRTWEIHRKLISYSLPQTTTPKNYFHILCSRIYSEQQTWFLPMDNTDHESPQIPDSADNPVSHLLPGSRIEYSAHESPPPSGTRPVREYGFIRTWLATSTDLRSTSDPTNVEWGIHWYTPVSIILLLLVGTATAIAHHVFYSLLHDTVVGDEVRQRWTSWIGSGLSFLTKVTLTAALGISRTQWVWLTLRRKWFTLEGIDALFGIISDPALFLNWRMMKQAKIATIMAVGMWMIPLAAILTPGTIAVRTVPRTETVSCSVPSFMFGYDDNSPGKIQAWTAGQKDVVPLSFIFFTTPDGQGFGMGTTADDWIFQTIIRSMTLPVYTGTITHLDTLPSVSLNSRNTLGAKCGANCTYTIEFVAPAIACTPMIAWSKTRWPSWEEYIGRRFYRAERLSESTAFIVGALLPLSGSAVFTCTESLAHYTVQHIIEERHFLEPVITKVEKVEIPGQKQWRSNDGAFPIYQVIYDNVIGNLTNLGTAKSRILQSILSGELYFTPSNLGNAIERMVQKMVVSMLPFSYEIDNQLHVLPVAAIQETNCTTTENIVIYTYSAGTLLLVYGLAVATALATSVAGFIALGQNGVASTKSVSTIIRTSRNRTLDDCIVGGDCLGGDTLSSDLKTMELQFGALKMGKTGTAPFALGVKGEIYPIKRN